MNLQEEHEYYKNVLIENYMQRKLRYFDRDLYEKSKKVKVTEQKTLYDFLQEPDQLCDILAPALTLVFDQFVLAKGNVMFHGIKIEDRMHHQWVEVDNHVYDTTLRMVFDKGLYYEVFDVQDVETLTSEQLLTSEKYQKLKETHIINEL